MSLYFGFTPVGTAGAADYYEVTGVQIDIGSVALPFRTYAATIQGELAACQRYLPAISSENSCIFGYTIDTNNNLIAANLPVTPRVAPTGISIPALSNFSGRNGSNSNYTPTNLVFAAGSLYNVQMTSAFTATTGQGCRVFLNNSSAYILFTGCEL
jgi:hypothetical protein